MDDVQTTPTFPSQQQWHNQTSSAPPSAQSQSQSQSQANANVDPSTLYTEPLDDPDLQEALEELKSGALVAEQDAEPEEGTEGDAARVVRRRATYSREHKLAAIHFATKTWITDQNGTRGIGRQQAAKILHLSWAVLSQWLSAANEIAAMPAGSVKNRRKGRRSDGIEVSPSDPFSGPRPRGRPRKMVIYHGPGQSSTGTLSEILASQTAAPSANTAALRAPNGPPSGYPPPQQSYASRPVPPSGTVPYDLPWTLSPAAQRIVQVVFCTLDDASKASNSDVQFCAITSSKIQDSLVAQSQLTATHVSQGSNVVHSTLKSAYITAYCSVSACSIENSMASNCTLTNCTVLNSQITGGQHVGRTFVNAFVTGNETNGAHRATTQEDDDMDDADGDAG